jgi:putative addiction module component (TIGR02574 family)
LQFARENLPCGTMILETLPQVSNLSLQQKFLLVTELWDELAAHPEKLPVSNEVIAELDQRMEAYRKDPSNVTTWEAIQTRLLGKPMRSE